MPIFFLDEMRATNTNQDHVPQVLGPLLEPRELLPSLMNFMPSKVEVDWECEFVVSSMNVPRCCRTGLVESRPVLLGLGGLGHFEGAGASEFVAFCG